MTANSRFDATLSEGTTVSDWDRLPPCREQTVELASDVAGLGELASRFELAHRRLNEVELALHEEASPVQRMSLLRDLESARSEYKGACLANVRHR